MSLGLSGKFLAPMGMGQMCGCGSAFPWECGAAPYGPGLQGKLSLKNDLQEALFQQAGMQSSQDVGK